MLTYANHTPEATEALPPLATIVLDAIVFQSVTTFCACKQAVASSVIVRKSVTRSDCMRYSLDSLVVVANTCSTALIPIKLHVNCHALEFFCGKLARRPNFALFSGHQ